MTIIKRVAKLIREKDLEWRNSVDENSYIDDEPPNKVEFSDKYSCYLAENILSFLTQLRKQNRKQSKFPSYRQICKVIHDCQGNAKFNSQQRGLADKILSKR